MSFVQSVAIDFDGVIHAYSKGWHDGSIYDKPIPGAFAAIKALMQDYAVFIFTTRDEADVAQWVAKHGKVKTEHMNNPPQFWNRQDSVLVTNKKLPAVAYIDDRGIRFESWDQAVADLYKYEVGV